MSATCYPYVWQHLATYISTTVLFSSSSSSLSIVSSHSVDLSSESSVNLLNLVQKGDASSSSSSSLRAEATRFPTIADEVEG